jgi:uncharacterized protein (TIGR03905 family)
LKYEYKTTGVCSNSIAFELEDGILKELIFDGGCSGNLQGIAALVRGMPAEEVVNRLKDIKCGFRNTSCPDQLALALQEVLNGGGSESVEAEGGKAENCEAEGGLPQP